MTDTIKIGRVTFMYDLGNHFHINIENLKMKNGLWMYYLTNRSTVFQISIKLNII